MKHWNQICHLSLVHFMAFPELQGGEGNFATTIHEVGHQNFFDALELGQITDLTERKSAVWAINDYGFRVGFGAQPIILSQQLNLNSPHGNERLKAIAILENYIDQAAELQSDRFVILSGKDPGDIHRSEAYHLLMDSIIEMGDYAQQYGMTIVLETFDRAVDKKALVGPSDEASVLAVEIRKAYPQFGLLYDMGHMPLLEEEPLTALSLLKEYLSEVHLGNCVKSPGSSIFGDKHPCFGFTGGVNGTDELVAFVKALFQVGYLSEEAQDEELPWVGFEIRPHNGQTSLEILENIQDTWVDAWSQL